MNETKHWLFERVTQHCSPDWLAVRSTRRGSTCSASYSFPWEHPTTLMGPGCVYSRGTQGGWMTVWKYVHVLKTKLKVHWFQEAKFTVMLLRTWFGCFSSKYTYFHPLCSCRGICRLFHSDVPNRTSISPSSVRQCHQLSNCFSDFLSFTFC